MHEGVGQAAEDERGVASRLLFLIAVAFSLFQLYTAAFTPFSSLVTRAVHVGFLLTLTFGFLARDGLAKGKRLVPLLFLACALLMTGIDGLIDLEILPRLSRRLWDSGWLLSDGNATGGFISALTGYRATPNLMELIAFIGYWAVVLLLIYRPRRQVTAAA